MEQIIYRGELHEFPNQTLLREYLENHRYDVWIKDKSGWQAIPPSKNEEPFAELPN